MKNYTLTTLTIAIMLASTLFINIGNATNQTTYTIQSTGKIDQIRETTVIIRGFIPNFNQNITEYVNNYVKNYTFGDNMGITLNDLQIDGILKYPNQFNSTYGTWKDKSWTWNQTKELIDAFHSFGWSVYWGSTGIAYENQWLYMYISQNHPELAFTDAKGYRANNAGNNEPNNNFAGDKTVRRNCLIPNFWANYSTPDSSLGIENNSRLIDVISSKLGQMIASGLSFDGWAPFDGWNGFNIQGYTFGNQNWGYEGMYSFGYQEESEWATDQTEYGLPAIGEPEYWNKWNITQRATWILENSTARNQWWLWWCNRFSEMHLTIKNVIEENNPNPQKYRVLLAADTSSQWMQGNLGGSGLINFTMLAEHGSVDLFYPAAENNFAQIGFKGTEFPQQQAYVSSLIKSKDARLNCAIGIIPDSWYDGNVALPLWNMKQQYLSQLYNYVWFNGTRYNAVDSDVIFLDGDPSGSNCNVNQTAIQQFFNWIETIRYLFENSEPLYLGPTKINGFLVHGNEGVNGLNYTFSQWADYNNIQLNPSYINKKMSSLFFELTDFRYYPLPNSAENIVYSLFANDKVNIIIGNSFETYNGAGSISKSLFSYGSELKVASTFSLNYSIGKSNEYAYVLNQNQMTDNTAKWLAKGYNSSTIWKIENLNYAYNYQALVHGSPIAVTTDGKVVLGIFTNSTSGRFLYMQMYSQGTLGSTQFTTTIPRELVNRAIYWASDSPVNSSNSLIDLKVLRSPDNTIIIPILNQNTTDNITKQQMDITLEIDSNRLGLSSISNYEIYWQSDPNTKINALKWNEIFINMSDMADVLVIKRI